MRAHLKKFVDGVRISDAKNKMSRTISYCESTSHVPSELENWREHAKISQDGINSLNSTRCQLIFIRSYLIGGKQDDENSITRFFSILKLRRAWACGGRRLHTIHVLLVAYKLRIIAFISFIELLSRNEASAHSHQSPPAQSTWSHKRRTRQFWLLFICIPVVSQRHFKVNETMTK